MRQGEVVENTTWAIVAFSLYSIQFLSSISQAISTGDRLGRPEGDPLYNLITKGYFSFQRERFRKRFVLRLQVTALFNILFYVVCLRADPTCGCTLKNWRR